MNEELDRQVVINIDVSEEENQIDGNVHVDIADQDGEEQLTAMNYAELIADIDHGCMMKSKVGVTGDIPERDSFPYFKSNKRWLCLMWGGNPDEWRLLSFEGERPDDIYDTESSFKATYLLISKITEVYLEVAPSTSFRVYQGQEVTRYTPIPESRDHAETWTNAIYAAMQLQAMDESETDNLRNRFIDEHLHYDEEEGDGEHVDENGLVVEHHGLEGDIEMGSGDRVRRDSTSSHVTTKSAFVDFHNIYGWNTVKKDDTPENAAANNSCCKMS